MFYEDFPFVVFSIFLHWNRLTKVLFYCKSLVFKLQAAYNSSFILSKNYVNSVFYIYRPQIQKYKIQVKRTDSKAADPYFNFISKNMWYKLSTTSHSSDPRPQAMCHLNVSSCQCITSVRVAKPTAVIQYWQACVWVLKGDRLTKHVSCLQERCSSPLDLAMQSSHCSCQSNIIMVTSIRKIEERVKRKCRV